MNIFRQDIVHALRLYRATPVASTVAVLVLGIALAFLTAFLSLYAELLPGDHAGFEQASELVTPAVRMPSNVNPVPLPMIRQLEDQVSGLERVAGIFRSNAEMVRTGEVIPLSAEFVTRGFFSGLRPRLARGRGIAPEQHEPDGLPEAVISHAFWQRHFGGNADVLGREIELQGSAFATTDENERTAFGRHRIVGVADRSLGGVLGGETDVWLAAERMLPILMTNMTSGTRFNVDSLSILRILARATSGRSIDSIESEIISRHEDGQFEGYFMPRDGRWRVYAGVTSDPVEQRRLRRQVGLFLLVSALVVVVAGANVGQFLLARAPGRRRELGIRIAVGAPMRRLKWQLVTEAAVLVVASLLAAVLLSLWLVVLLQELAFLQSSQWGDVSLLNWRVLASLALVTTATVLLVSLAPIAGLRRIGVSDATRSVRARASLFQRLGAALQVCVAGIVSCVALAFGVYLADLAARDAGWNPEDVFQIAPKMRGVVMSSDGGRDGLRLLRERRRQMLLAVPGIEAVGFGAPVPLGRVAISMSSSVPLPDRPEQTIDIVRNTADRGYPDVIGMRIVHGEWPGPDDHPGYVINRAAAEALFGNAEATGSIFPGSEGPELDPGPVIAVVEDVAFSHPSEPDRPRIYEPDGPLSMLESILVKTRLPAEELRRELDRLIESGELEFEIESIDRLTDRLRELLAPDRARMQMSALAAVVVLVLALIGFYATQRFLVEAGKREYAILAALGAGPKRLRRLVMRRGLLLGLPGLAFAVPLGFITLAWLKQDFLPEDVPTPALVVAVALVLAALLLLASAGPARRAAAVAPAEQLRQD